MALSPLPERRAVGWRGPTRAQGSRPVGGQEACLPQAPPLSGGLPHPHPSHTARLSRRGPVPEGPDIWIFLFANWNLSACKN